MLRLMWRDDKLALVLFVIVLLLAREARGDQAHSDPVFECFPSHGNWLYTSYDVVPWDRIREFRFYVDGKLMHQTPFDATINHDTYDPNLTACHWHSGVLEIPLGEHDVGVTLVLNDGTESELSPTTHFSQYIGPEAPAVEIALR